MKSFFATAVVICNKVPLKFQRTPIICKNNVFKLMLMTQSAHTKRQTHLHSLKLNKTNIYFAGNRKKYNPRNYELVYIFGYQFIYLCDAFRHHSPSSDCNRITTTTKTTTLFNKQSLIYHCNKFVHCFITCVCTGLN